MARRVARREIAKTHSKSRSGNDGSLQGLLGAGIGLFVTYFGGLMLIPGQSPRHPVLPCGGAAVGYVIGALLFRLRASF